MKVTHHIDQHCGISNRYVLLHDGQGPAIKLPLPPDAVPQSPRQAVKLAAAYLVDHLKVLADLRLLPPAYADRRLRLYHQLELLTAETPLAA